MDAVICIASVFGVFAWILFLWCRRLGTRWIVGKVFICSGLVGCVLHGYRSWKIGRESGRYDVFDFLADNYFVVTIYLFCCYLFFSREKPETKSHSKPQQEEEVEVVIPENILEDPNFGAGSGPVAHLSTVNVKENPGE